MNPVGVLNLIEPAKQRVDLFGTFHTLIRRFFIISNES
jgi:hypothetical protein